MAVLSILLLLLTTSILAHILPRATPVPHFYPHLIQSLNQTTGASPTFGPSTIPFANITSFVSPVWTTLPMSALLTQEPFCENEADPDANIGNHCVCKNGATIAIIPLPTGSAANMSDYQPCAYTTVGGKGNLTTTSVQMTTVVTVTKTGSSVNGSVTAWFGTRG